MSIVDAISFIAALLFLLVSSRQRAKRRGENQIEEDVEAETPFEQREERRIQELQQWIHGRVESEEKRLPLPPHVNRPPKPSTSPVANSGIKSKANLDHEVGPRVGPRVSQGGGPGIAQESTRRERQEQRNRASVAPACFAQPEVAEAYHIPAKESSSRAVHLLEGLKSPKEMVVLHEIFSPPKGL